MFFFHAGGESLITRSSRLGGRERMHPDDKTRTEPRLPEAERRPQRTESAPGPGRVYKGGYRSALSKASITLFNVVLGSLMILFGIPVFLAVAAAVKLLDPGPLFYKSIRLGLHKKPFAMLKFRSLPVGTDGAVGERILAPKHLRLSAFSRFIRDTRLDELPQLFNIIKGDMDFIGPRPIRPELYEREGKRIPNFDLRFSVRPGLIGYSQLFTPHSSPKRIRALIDNKFTLRGRSLLWDLAMIFFTVAVIVRDVILKGAGTLWREVVLSKYLLKYTQKRCCDRIRSRRITGYLLRKHREKAESAEYIEIVDINDYHFKAFMDSDISEGEHFFRFDKYISTGQRRKRKRALCRGKVFKTLPCGRNSFKHLYVVSYAALTPLNRYILDKYFLHKSIV